MPNAPLRTAGASSPRPGKGPAATVPARRRECARRRCPQARICLFFLSV
ncbi:MAG: hypothetical protein OXU61_04650 [Gammaproteobacteria bacterium]|nr:hypothetical protein [Gammaproteobacteria bacterium]